MDQYDKNSKYGSAMNNPQAYTVDFNGRRQGGQQNTFMGVNNIRQEPVHPLIDRPDYTNKNEILHNNIHEKVFTESVYEYKIHISSADRNMTFDGNVDTTYSPSPFKMKIMFGSGNQTPKIERKFENIKYISLDSLILPRTIEIDTTNASTSYLYPAETKYRLPTSMSAPAPAPTANTMNILENRRSLFVRIVNLSSYTKFLGSSPLLDKNTFEIVMDYDTGFDNCVWKPLHNSRIIYPNSNLGQLTELTLELLDEYGKQLQLYDGDGNNILLVSTANLNNETYNKYVSSGSGARTIDYTNNVTQVWYNFTVGVTECEINTTASTRKI